MRSPNLCKVCKDLVIRYHYSILAQKNMDPFISLFIGPLGQSFSVMDQYRFLPKESNFTELTDEMYKLFIIKEGIPSERIYLLSVDSQQNEKELLIVTETEKQELFRGRQLIENILKDVSELESATDMERLDYFKKLFPFLFKKPQNQEEQKTANEKPTPHPGIIPLKDYIKNLHHNPDESQEGNK